jgi:hypothetical protein
MVMWSLLGLIQVSLSEPAREFTSDDVRISNQDAEKGITGPSVTRPCIGRHAFIRKGVSRTRAIFSSHLIALQFTQIRTDILVCLVTLAVTMKLSAFVVLSALCFVSADRTFNITSALAKGQFDKYSCL